MSDALIVRLCRDVVFVRPPRMSVWHVNQVMSDQTMAYVYHVVKALLIVASAHKRNIAVFYVSAGTGSRLTVAVPRKTFSTDILVLACGEKQG